MRVPAARAVPRRGAGLLVTLALAAAACGGSPAGTDTRDGDTDGLRIVATTTILGDITSSVVQDAAAVEVLMQPGQDPHAFEPSAQQAAMLRDASLVVANGLGLEEPLTDLLSSAEEDGVAILRVAEHLDPLEYPDPEHAEDGGDGHGGTATDEEQGEPHRQDDGHGHGPLDPHVHLDPLRMARAAELIADRLARLPRASDHVDWQQRGAQAAAAIRSAHEEAESALAVVPPSCRTLVTNHESLHYFAARYGFEVAGAVIPGGSTQAEPSARDFAQLVAVVRDTGVPAIVAETTHSTRLAETLAAEVGREVRIVTLFTDSLGEDGSGAQTYAGLVTTNAQRIADAFATC